MEIRYFKGKEILRTRTLYETVFQDTRAFTDFFYEKAVRECTAVVALQEGCVAAEVFLVPKKLLYGGNVIKSFYVYGVATAPEYRGQGLMRTLMETAENYAALQEAECLYLIPVKEEIYEGLGYQIIKKEERRIWEQPEQFLTDSLTMETLTPETFTRTQYLEIKQFEKQFLHPEELHPLRDEQYFRERIQRAALEGGSCYLFRRGEKRKIAALFLTEECGQGKLLDALVQPQEKADIIQAFLRQRGIQSLEEIIFPVMLKKIGDRHILWNGKISGTGLNDEI